MSLAKYSDMTDSGIHWLGEVPLHWNVVRLRHIAELNPSKSEVSELDRETLVSFLPMEAVGDDGTIKLEQTRPISTVENGYTYFREGDVTLAKITPCFENGKGAVMRGLLNGVGFGTTELIVVRPQPEHSTSDYLHWLFMSSYFRRIGESTMYGAGGQKRVPDNFVRNYSLAIPPLAEQQAISSFLDVETSKIDDLVSEQRRLIELLKEKRQAVISHAVTKGLNPNAPMKPSGIEWLGDVPLHWTVSSLRHFATFYTGSTPARDNPAFWNGDIRWVKTGEIKYKLITETEETITQEGLDQSSCSIAPEGTLLMALYGQGVTRGRVAILGVPAAFNQACVAITVDDRISNDFLHTFFIYAYLHIRDVGNETTQMNMNVEFVRRISVVVPPREEQQEIVAYVTKRVERLTQLQAEAERAIALLKERRTALISAAVTGKIDVRDFAAMGAVV